MPFSSKPRLMTGEARRHLASGYLTVRYGQCPIHIDDLPCSLPLKWWLFQLSKRQLGFKTCHRFPYSWENQAPAILIHSSYLQRPSIYKPHGGHDKRHDGRFSSPPRCRIRCYPPFEAPGRKFGELLYKGG